MKFEECEALIDRKVSLSFRYLHDPQPSPPMAEVFFLAHLIGKGGESNMALVVLRSGESQDSLLKRFRKKVVKSGV